MKKLLQFALLFTFLLMINACKKSETEQVDVNAYNEYISMYPNSLISVTSNFKFGLKKQLENAKIENDIVHLQMQNVAEVEVFDAHSFLDTGSPHHVELVSDLENFEVKSKGSKIRSGQPYNKAGTNVNFVEQISEAHFAVRTYERGVEDETLSCGTGVTAVALAMHKTGKTTANTVELKTQGGHLTVTFNANENGYNAIWLVGAAQQVFKGELVW